MPVFDVIYSEADVELSPAGLGLGFPFPRDAVRLRLSGFTPAAVMVSTAALYWFALVPFVFPRLRPHNSDGNYARALKRWRSRHNLVLFLYSGACCGATAMALVSSRALFSWTRLLCEPVAGTWLRPLSVTFVISKLWEWGDTFFLVTLGSRPPEFLHKYHHATTFWLFCLVINLPGPEKFGLLLNGGVHTLMYAHYWRPFPKPLVPLITVLQIVQLATVTYAWHVSPHVCPAAAFADAPRAHRLEVLTPYLMVPVYLFFFVVFFVKRFLLPQKKRASPKRD